MIDERVRKAHAIFVGALGCREHERESYVRQACASDEALQRDVERLLAALEQSTNFLESPAVHTERPGGSDVQPQSTPQIRGFHVIRTLGAGGMASVYEAQQQHPNRRVALKVMHRSLAKTSALQRFRLETEILARLKHPGIAQIYEAGTLEDDAGRPIPFFTMELVEDGLPITTYVTRKRMDLRSRLELFASVCDAVGCGHHAGIIHRDLKPSNVLVDDERRIKVIDFGIARSLGPVQSRITLDADRTRLMGTLNYMSPEQCSGDDVDTRTDVYSLGVMLYELVTGTLPHDLSSTSLPEAARIIQHVQPERPSALVRDVAGDLEMIIMTAINKERDRRYRGASELGEDIRRLVANEPIRARPPTILYQARKFTQRHWALVGGTVMTLLILAVAAVTTSRMAYVANRNRIQAERRERELKLVTDFQRSQLSGIDVAAMGERLHEMLAEKITPVAGSPEQVQRLLENVNFTSTALSLLHESVLERSHVAINERFADQPLLQARLLQTLAATMNTLGLSEGAEPILKKALAIRRTELGDDHPDTLTSRHAMGSLLGSLGRYEEADEILRDTYDRRVRILGADDPETLRTANTRGGVLRHMGRLDEAAVVWRDNLVARRRVLGDDHRDTLISLNNVGVICAIKGDLDGAETAWRELLDRRKRIFGEDHPLYQTSLTNLGLLLVERGKLTEARPLLEQSLNALLAAKGENHPSTLSTMSSLASLLVDLKDPAAEGLLRRCLEARSKNLGANHPDALRSRTRLAAFAIGQNKGAQAAHTLKDVLALQRDAFGPDHPDTIETMCFLADALVETGELEKANALATECVERARTLTPDASAPNAAFLVTQARTLSALHRFKEAETVLLRAYASLSGSIGEKAPRTRRVAEMVADLYATWGQVDPTAERNAAAATWRNRLIDD